MVTKMFDLKPFSLAPKVQHFDASLMLKGFFLVLRGFSTFFADFRRKTLTKFSII